MTFDDAEDTCDVRTVYVPCNRCQQLEAFLRRMLNPEDLGLAVQWHVRDEVRAILGMKRCEYLEP